MVRGKAGDWQFQANTLLFSYSLSPYSSEAGSHDVARAGLELTSLILASQGMGSQVCAAMTRPTEQAELRIYLHSKPMN